jgi:hypothetical protein
MTTSFAALRKAIRVSPDAGEFKPLLLGILSFRLNDRNVSEQLAQERSSYPGFDEQSQSGVAGRTE